MLSGRGVRDLKRAQEAEVPRQNREGLSRVIRFCGHSSETDLPTYISANLQGCNLLYTVLLTLLQSTFALPILLDSPTPSPNPTVKAGKAGSPDISLGIYRTASSNPFYHISVPPK